ncbi:MAG: RNA-binding protein [Patescibacteria group bacterium]
MSKKLFVGNLDWNLTAEAFKEAFGQFGSVEEAVIIKDKFSGKSKGFGFVTFTNDEEADKALSEMDGHELNGRKMAVNEARPQENKR